MGTNETAGGSGNTGPSEFKDSNTGHAHDNYVRCSAAGGMTSKPNPWVLLKLQIYKSSKEEWTRYVHFNQVLLRYHSGPSVFTVGRDIWGSRRYC